MAVDGTSSYQDRATGGGDPSDVCPLRTAASQPASYTWQVTVQGDTATVRHVYGEAVFIREE